MKADDRGRVDLDSEECKGCGLCVEACPPKVLALAPHLNPYGYHPVTTGARAAPDAASVSLLVRNPARSSCGGFGRRHPLRRPEPRDGPSVGERGGLCRRS
jgi:ferredoxin